MNTKRLLEQHVTQALEAAGAPVGSAGMVRPAGRPGFGDYQANGVMAVAKKLKMNPREFGAKVIDALDMGDIAEKVELAGPGFINIHLKNDWLSGVLTGAGNDPKCGVDSVADADTVVIDYSSPNLAKEMHVGHLRSTIIGDAIVRVLDFLGHKVVRQNHVGDWGTQFGMLIAYMVRLQDEGKSDLSTELTDLVSFYRAANALYSEDPVFAATARDYVVKLQGGDEACRKLWHQFIDTSLEHCEQVYRQLGVLLTRDDVQPESAYNDDLPKVIEDLEQGGMLTESDGAMCVFLDEFKGKDDKPLPAIVRKSDGGYLYATTDLAAIRYRTGQLGSDRVLYFVDARQDLHLRQVFSIAKKAGFAPAETSLEHHAFGTMMGEDGKPFKTRASSTVRLTDLLQEAEQRAYDLVTSKNPDLPEEQRRSIGQVVGMGAVKFADLSKNRVSDYVFSWDSMLSFDGKTAPYLQYAYTRVQSIFRKAGIEQSSLTGDIVITEPAERVLGIKLLQFSEVVERVASECYPHELCSYLYEVAGAFMSYYEACPVLKSEEPVRTSRLLLSALTAKVLGTGLDLLGINTVEQM